eukprot:scaffold1069_cov186-Ochromonas_danica.AAC.5
MCEKTVPDYLSQCNFCELSHRTECCYWHSLFNNISTEDTSTMNGFVINTVLFSRLSDVSTLSVLCDQTYYKQIYFFPTTAFTFAQMLVFLILHVSIVYVS